MATILKEGIRPDADPTWSSGRCRSLGGVCLFDFRVDLAVIARQFHLWRPWVRGTEGGLRCKVWLRLDMALPQ
jgi:hypothetical protein